MRAGLDQVSYAGFSARVCRPEGCKSCGLSHNVEDVPMRLLVLSPPAKSGKVSLIIEYFVLILVETFANIP